MTAIGLIGLFLSILAIAIGRSTPTISRLSVSVALLAVHLAAAFYYYQYSLTSIADAWSYYFDPLNTWNRPFAMGMMFVFKLVHFMRTTLGATYLDCFLVFQSVGFAGIMVMLRIFDEIEANVGVQNSRGYAWLLFLPSVNFWTACIGKDAPLFFAIALCVWSILRLRQRLPFFCLALVIMILFRPHIGLMAAAALAAATFVGSSTSAGRKFAMLAVALAGIWFAMGPVENTFNVDVTSYDSVSTFLDNKNSEFATLGGTTSVGDVSVPYRVVSLLFRPFFFDAGNFLGIVASVENIGVMLAFLYVFTHWRNLMLLARRVVLIRFCLVFATLILVSLTLVYFNVGLGLRQRVMAYPMFFSVLVAMWSLSKRQAPAQPSVQAQPGLMPQPVRQRALPEV